MRKYQVEGNIKFPFFLTPEKHYVGDAWYRKSVYVPESWKGQHITLYLERPHIETTSLYKRSECRSPDVPIHPHQYNVTPLIVPGQRNTIAIKVYNGIENVCVGQDSHSVTDQTQGNWNGIVGTMELRSQPDEFYIKKVKVTPNIATRLIRLHIELGGYPKTMLYSIPEMSFAIERVGHPEEAQVYYCDFDASELTFDIPMWQDMVVWDEFQPISIVLVSTWEKIITRQRSVYAT